MTRRKFLLSIPALLAVPAVAKVIPAKAVHWSHKTFYPDILRPGRYLIHLPRSTGKAIKAR